MYKYNMGGSVPRETNIGGQRHSLAYINPFEEDLLNTQYRGGEGQPMPPVPGPGGVPAYPPAGRSGGSGYTTTAPKTTTYKRGSGRDERLQEEANKNKAANLQKTLDTLASTAARQDEIDANKQAAESMLGAGVTNVGGSGTATREEAERKINLQKTLDTLTAGAARQNEIDAAAPVAQPTQANSLTESLANFLTPGDMMEYVNGQLVYGPKHPKAGQPVAEGEKNSFGFTAGMADTAPGGGIMGALSGAVSGAVDDVTMGMKAGLFSTREKGIENLKNVLDENGNRVYSDADIADYYARTDATKQRMKDQAAANYANRGDDKDMTAAVIDDPCPEGYKLDPITNECVMDDTIDVLNPGGQQVTDFVMPSVNPVIGQAANYTGAVAPTNMPMPLQPYAPGTSGNLLQSSAPGLARTRAGGIMGL